MRLLAFALLDSKAAYFSTPFFAVHRGAAIRIVTELANDLSTQVGRHPADFVLYELGGFDDQTGSLDVATPSNLGPCSQFVVPQPQPLPLGA